MPPNTSVPNVTARSTRLADAVGQRMAGGARLDQSGAALVEEHHRAKGFHGFPERVEARVVEGDTVDVVVDRDAAVFQGGHRVLGISATARSMSCMGTVARPVNRSG